MGCGGSKPEAAENEVTHAGGPPALQAQMVQPVIPMAQPVVPMAQPVIPMAQPVMLMAQPVVEGFALQEVWGMRTLEGHSSALAAVALSGDGTRIVSGSFDRTVRVWDAQSGECLRTLEGHSDWVKSVALSGDGTRIVSGGLDDTVRVWDAQSG